MRTRITLAATALFVAALSGIASAQPPPSPSGPPPALPAPAANRYSETPAEAQQVSQAIAQLDAADCHRHRVGISLKQAAGGPAPGAVMAAGQGLTEPPAQTIAEAHQAEAHAKAACGVSAARHHRSKRAHAAVATPIGFYPCYLDAGLSETQYTGQGYGEVFHWASVHCAQYTWIEVEEAPMSFNWNSGAWTYHAGVVSPTIWALSNGVGSSTLCAHGSYYDTWGWDWVANPFGSDSGSTYAASPLWCD